MLAFIRKLLSPRLRHSWQYYRHPVYGQVRYDHITHKWQRLSIHGTYMRWHKPHCRYNRSHNRWEFTV